MSNGLFLMIFCNSSLAKYADALYICNIISALATATVPSSPPERGELTSEAKTEVNEEDKELLKQAVSEVVRYRNMDRLVPSAHNVVTIAALEVSFLYVSIMIRMLSMTQVPLGFKFGELDHSRLQTIFGLFKVAFTLPWLASSMSLIC